VDDLVAGGGLGDVMGGVIGAVIGAVIDADLLIGHGRQLGGGLNGHEAEEGDVSADVIAELLNARQPLAAQLDVGGRDVTLDQRIL